MVSWFLEPFTFEFMQRALVAAVLVGAVAPVVGTWIVLQRLSYMGDAMGHASLGGVAAAYLAGFSVTAGAVAAGALMAALMALLARHPRLAGDSIIGIVEVTLFAGGVLLVSRSENVGVDLSHFLFGSITTVTSADLWLNAALALVAFAGVGLLWRDLRAMTFDPQHARLVGIRGALMQPALLMLLAITVVLALQTVGLLMSIALLIVPAAAARLWTHTTETMSVLAATIGVVSCVVGLTLSYHLGAAPGATIALVTVAALVVSAVATLPRRIRLPAAHAADLPNPKVIT